VAHPLVSHRQAESIPPNPVILRPAQHPRTARSAIGSTMNH
jgi:hypothetical protein